MVISKSKYVWPYLSKQKRTLKVKREIATYSSRRFLFLLTTDESSFYFCVDVNTALNNLELLNHFAILERAQGSTYTWKRTEAVGMDTRDIFAQMTQEKQLRYIFEKIKVSRYNCICLYKYTKSKYFHIDFKRCAALFALELCSSAKFYAIQFVCVNWGEADLADWRAWVLETLLAGHNNS